MRTNRLLFLIGFIVFILPGLLFALDKEPKHNPPVGGHCIYLSTGEFYQDVTDLTIPGRGFPFRFTRVYRSKSEYDGPIGYNWDFNYNARIIASTDYVDYLNGLGANERYYKTSTGDFISAPGCYNILAYSSGTDTYTLTERDGTKYKFELKGSYYKLTEIKDRNNNTISLSYNGSNQLSTITDTLGRVITFAYTGNKIDYFEDWFSPNPRRVDFTYDGNGDLWKVTSPTTTEYPSGKTTIYTYSTGFGEARLNHNLLTITDPKGQVYLTNYYNEIDRCWKQDYGTGTFIATYTAQAKVTQQDRNGNVVDYELGYTGNVITTTKYTRGIRPGDPASFITVNTNTKETERTKTIFPKGNSVEYTRDTTNSDRRAQGNLLSVRRKATGYADIVTSMTYESHYQQVKTSRDAREKITTFYYDWEEIRDTVDYNGDGQYGPDHGNVVKIVYPTVTLPDATQQIIESKFKYNAYGQIIESIDPENIVTLYEYYTSGASNGYLWKVTRNYGQTPSATTEYAYDSVGNITSIKDARGNTTAFLVNELNQVYQTTSRSPFNYQVKFSYDENDNLEKTEVQNIDENGSTGSPEWIPTDYTYDILDNLYTKTEAITNSLTAVTTYGRDNNENLTQVTQPETNIRKTTYDERDLVYETFDGWNTPEQLTTKNYYDNNGNLTQAKIGDGNKGTITHQYDGFDRRTQTTDALGNYAITEYDANSNVTRVHRYNSFAQKLSDVFYYYDEMSRMYKIIAKKFDTPGGAEIDIVTTLWFDKKSRRWKTERTKGAQTLTTTIDFDNLDRIESVTDPVGNKVEYISCDENGNPLTIKETEKKTGGDEEFYTYNEYDNLDRLISTTNWAGTTLFKYDSRNNNKETTDRENHLTKRNYDLINRLNENIYVLATGNISVKYGLDKNGRMVTLTDDNNNITEYEYDNVNRRKFERLPDDTTKQYTFTQYGTLYQLTDNNGSIVTHSYDNALRLSDKTINRATGVYGTTYENFGYDGLSRMTSAQNDDSTIGMTYDSLGNLLTETQNGKTATSVYDELSFRTSLTYPGTKYITLWPDELSRIEQIKDASSNVIASYTYAGQNRITGRSYYNGTSLSVTYDDGRRAITYTHGAIIGGFGYSFDKMNNKLYENRTFDSKGNAFKYDEIYRLTGVKYGVSDLNPSTTYDNYNTYDSKEEFTLDGVGNRETVITNSTTTSYTTNNLNQYTQISGTVLNTLDYDLNGNLRWDGVITCTYNYANQLIKVVRSSDLQILGEYKYDCLSRRIWKKAWNGTAFVETYFYYDGVRCIEERNASDAVLKTYVFGNGIDEVLTAEQSGTTYYYHENSLGSIYAVSDGSGVIVERYRYTVYGSCTFLDQSGDPISQSAIGNRLLFTGRELDVESGLFYCRMRYYSPEFGRFIQRDPLEHYAGINLYCYVKNNPTNKIDPYGLKEEDWKLLANELDAIGGIPTDFIRAVAKDTAISFSGDVPEYKSKSITLPTGFKDAKTGRLKSIAELHPSALGIVIHELWHAYYTQVLSKDKEKMKEFEKIAERYKPYMHPWSESLSTEVMEEAIGGYLQNVINTYVEGVIQRIGKKITAKELDEWTKDVKETKEAIRKGTKGYYLPWFRNYLLWIPKEDRKIDIIIPMSEDEQKFIDKQIPIGPNKDCQERLKNIEFKSGRVYKDGKLIE